MKLAEALSIRKDLQKRIQQIRRRLIDNVKVQEVWNIVKNDLPVLRKQIGEILLELGNLE